MAFDFKFPDVGEGIHEGELVEWLVKEGDVVKADQAIANVETDKAVVEIPCPRAGTVLKLHAKVGDTIKVGEVLVTIGSAGEKYAGPAAAPAVTPPAAQAKAPTATVSKAQPTPPPPRPPPPPPPRGGGGGGPRLRCRGPRRWPPTRLTHRQPPLSPCRFPARCWPCRTPGNWPASWEWTLNAG